MDIRKARDEIWQGASLYTLPLRVTHYSRVSTDKFEQASSLENQESYFTEFIQKNPNWIYVPGYVDDGISGTSTLKRDSFNRMIADARLGRFDLIITKEISRCKCQAKIPPDVLTQKSPKQAKRKIVRAC